MQEAIHCCRAQSLALFASSPCPAYFSPSPDHFLLPLKPGAPLCCCQTGYPTSCERQEGALLLAPDTKKSALQQPPTIPLLSPQTYSSKNATRAQRWTRFLSNWGKTSSSQITLKQKLIRINSWRCTSNLWGSQQLTPICLSLFWTGSPMLQWTQARPPSDAELVVVWVAAMINRMQIRNLVTSIFFLHSFLQLIQMHSQGLSKDQLSTDGEWQRSIPAVGQKLCM